MERSVLVVWAGRSARPVYAALHRYCAAFRSVDTVALAFHANFGIKGATLAGLENKIIAAAWSQGVAVNWRLLYPHGTPAMISLPTYPFAREHYWLDTAALARFRGGRLDPWLQRNISDLDGVRFSSVFPFGSSARDFSVATCVAMAHAATTRLAPHPDGRWHIRMDGLALPAVTESAERTVEIALQRGAEGHLAFEIVSHAHDDAEPALAEPALHARGVCWLSSDAPESVNAQPWPPMSSDTVTWQRTADRDEGFAAWITLALRAAMAIHGDGDAPLPYFAAAVFAASAGTPGADEWLRIERHPDGTCSVAGFDGEGHLQSQVESIVLGASIATTVAPAATLDDDLAVRVLEKLKALFSQVARIAVERIDVDESLEAYGLDSVMVMQLNGRFASVFGELSKTLMYEHPSLSSLAGWFATAQAARCAAWCGKHSALQPRAFAAASAKVRPAMTRMRRGGSGRVLAQPGRRRGQHQ